MTKQADTPKRTRSMGEIHVMRAATVRTGPGAEPTPGWVLLPGGPFETTAAAEKHIAKALDDGEYRVVRAVRHIRRATKTVETTSCEVL